MARIAGFRKEPVCISTSTRLATPRARMQRLTLVILFGLRHGLVAYSELQSYIHITYRLVIL